MKTGRSLGHSDVSLELIAAGMKVGMQLMVELYQSVLDRLEMTDE